MWSQLTKEIKILIIFLAIAFVFGCGLLMGKFFFADKAEDKLILTETKTESLETEVEVKKKAAEEIYVYLSGAIEKPDVYKVPAGSRIFEVLKLATLAKDADLSMINLAAPLTDGQMVVIPKEGEVLADKTTALSQGVSKQEQGKVNLNAATLEELDTLPGVGPSTAQKIIDYRDQNGGFKSIDELDNVPGIGPKKFEELKDLVTI